MTITAADIKNNDAIWIAAPAEQKVRCYIATRTEGGTAVIWREREIQISLDRLNNLSRSKQAFTSKASALKALADTASQAIDKGLIPALPLNAAEQVAKCIERTNEHGAWRIERGLTDTTFAPRNSSQLDTITSQAALLEATYKGNTWTQLQNGRLTTLVWAYTDTKWNLENVPA